MFPPKQESCKDLSKGANPYYYSLSLDAISRQLWAGVLLEVLARTGGGVCQDTPGADTDKATFTG